MKQIVIIGAGGFARTVAWLIEEINVKHKEWEIIGHVDEDCSKHGQLLNNYKVIGGLTEIGKLPKDVHLICAIGNPQARHTVIKK